MNRVPYDITVEFDDGTEEEVEVLIDQDRIANFETNSEIAKYVTKLAMQTSNKIKKVQFNKADVPELMSVISDFTDTSIFHPNESYDEFMEHEDYYD